MSIAGSVLSPALNNVSISVMTEHDLSEVVEIEEQCELSRWGWNAYHAELQTSGRGLMLVARVCQSAKTDAAYSLAGYIAARLTGSELHINNVAVRQPFRRRGLGSALLVRILAEGKRLGALAAFLEVRAGNVAAQALYERCGLHIVGQRPNYYSQPVEDATIMSVPLEQDA